MGVVPGRGFGGAPPVTPPLAPPLVLLLPPAGMSGGVVVGWVFVALGAGAGAESCAEGGL